MQEHVLIVEDDNRISDAIGLRLRANRYHVSVAPNACEAVEQVLADTPDIVLMDINLPDGNGLVLAARMRVLRATVDVPIIFFTASRDPEYCARARALGIRLLEKPFPATLLLDTIVGTLAEARLARARAKSGSTRPDTVPDATLYHAA